MSDRTPNLDVLMNVSLSLSAELGRASMSVRQIIEMGTGAIVALDRPAGGPIDIFVNEKIVARGEIVAVDDRYGVRITELCG